MSTFLELCQKYPKITGITGNIPYAVTNQTGMNEKICIWIADADLLVQRLYHDWNFLRTEVIISITEGTAAYSLTTMGITDLNSWEKDKFILEPGSAAYTVLTEMKYDDWLTSSYRVGASSSDKPSQFVIKPDNSLVFVDTPDDDYTAWANYFKKPTRMAANTDTSDIPVQFEDIILFRAKMSHAEYYEDMALYQSAYKNFRNELTRLEAHSLPDQEPKTAGASDPANMIITAE